MLNVAGGKPEFNAMQDFMAMSTEDVVQTELQRMGDTTLAPQKCYSDSIFLFDKNFKKTRFIIVITSHSISFFNMKKTKMFKLFLLKSLKSISISTDNFTLSVFQFANQADLLTESYRRLEMISYLNQMFHESQLPKFNLVIRKRFIIKADPKQQVPEKLEVGDPNLKINLPHLQDTIRNAKKSGYLIGQKKSWYGTSTTEYFCVLCNLGIILFKKYGVS